MEDLYTKKMRGDHDHDDGTETCNFQVDECLRRSRRWKRLQQLQQHPDDDDDSASSSSGHGLAPNMLGSPGRRRRRMGRRMSDTPSAICTCLFVLLVTTILTANAIALEENPSYVGKTPGGGSGSDAAFRDPMVGQKRYGRRWSSRLTGASPPWNGRRSITALFFGHDRLVKQQQSLEWRQKGPRTEQGDLQQQQQQQQQSSSSVQYASYYGGEDDNDREGGGPAEEYYDDPYPRIPYSPDLKPWRPGAQSTNSASVRQGRRGGAMRRRKKNPLSLFLESTDWTSRLLAANVLLYGLQVLNPAVTRGGVKLSQRILNGEQLYRLITPVFLHGGLAHLVINSASLKNMGPTVERSFGRPRFLATYLGAGIAGNLFSCIGSPNPGLGASGAILGLCGAYYTFLQMNEPFFGRSARAGMTAIKRTLVTNLGYGLMSSSIDNWAHLGGLVGGAAMAYAFGPKLYVTHLPPDGRRVVVDRPNVRLPRLVMSALSPKEMKMKFQRWKRRMQTERFTSDLSARPWRRKK